MSPELRRGELILISLENRLISVELIGYGIVDKLLTQIRLDLQGIPIFVEVESELTKALTEL